MNALSRTRVVSTWALVIVSALVVALIAIAVNSMRGASATAEGVLVIPPDGRSSAQASSSSSVQVAATYAAAMRGSTALIRLAAQKTGDTSSALQEAVSIHAVRNAGAVSVVVSGATRARAEKRAWAVSAVLAKPSGLGSLGASLQGLSPVTNTSALSARAATNGTFRVSLVYLASVQAGSQDPAVANRLAASYAGLIVADTASLTPAARSIRISVEKLRDSLRIFNDPNTSLLRIRVTRPDYADARTAVTSLMEGLVAPEPVSAVIAPRSLALVREPDATAPAKGRAWLSAGIIGAVVGAGLGVMLVAVRRRSQMP